MLTDIVLIEELINESTTSLFARYKRTDQRYFGDIHMDEMLPCLKCSKVLSETAKTCTNCGDQDPFKFIECSQWAGAYKERATISKVLGFVSGIGFIPSIVIFGLSWASALIPIGLCLYFVHQENKNSKEFEKSVEYFYGRNTTCSDKNIWQDAFFKKTYPSPFKI